MKMYRQGDVLLVETKEPTATHPRESLVVLEGEITGHSHRLTSGAVLDCLEDTFVHAVEGTKMVHEEHDTITIPEGWYKVIRQREYDEKEIRYVRD